MWPHKTLVIQSELGNPPSMINMNGIGSYTVTRLNSTHQCPPTHFLCPDNLCLPVYLLCNGVRDCHGGGDEDEVKCLGRHCQGYYKCWRSNICLHPDHVCDDVAQCPHRDDDMLCYKPPCPSGCVCQGWAFVCQQSSFNLSHYPSLRFLHTRNTSMRLDEFTNNQLLIHLYLTHSSMTNFMKSNLSNLMVLDISHNSLTSIDTSIIPEFPNLNSLVLSHNPIDMIFSSENVPFGLFYHTIQLT